MGFYLWSKAEETSSPSMIYICDSYLRNSLMGKDTTTFKVGSSTRNN